VAHKPYFRLIEPGLHLGYRKLASGPGTWIARRYSGEGRYVVENLRAPDGALVLADDYNEADGQRVMSFAQAQHAARGPRGARAGGLTVAHVMGDYLAFLSDRPAHAVRDARYKTEAHILPSLGNVKISSLSPERLRHWRDSLARTPARVRTRPGEQQNHRAAGDPRSRRATVNRIWATLRAALNHAFAAGKIETDVQWRQVRPFKGVTSARARYLSLAEAKRLINACPPEFRLLVQAALQTGCRYSEIARLHAHDFNPDARTVAIRQSKVGKARHVVLTDEGAQFFAGLAAGRSGGDLLFRRPNGEPWGTANQQHPMQQACERAKIVPRITFHGLRHTWASLAVMNGVPLMVVAKNLGHADTHMVEHFYGHLAPSYVVDAIRAGAPRFGRIGAGNIRPLR
jgi:integrase